MIWQLVRYISGSRLTTSNCTWRIIEESCSFPEVGVAAHQGSPASNPTARMISFPERKDRRRIKHRRKFPSISSLKKKVNKSAINEHKIKQISRNWARCRVYKPDSMFSLRAGLRFFSADILDAFAEFYVVTLAHRTDGGEGRTRAGNAFVAAPHGSRWVRRKSRRKERRGPACPEARLGTRPQDPRPSSRSCVGVREVLEGLSCASLCVAVYLFPGMME